MSIFTKGPSVEYNKAPKDDVDVVSYPRLVIHDNTLYLLFKGFYALDQSTNEWETVEIPFQIGTGMSMISTPKGLVVYGGEISGSRVKEMWILSEGKWRPIPANLKCRTCHACTWVPTYNGLLIHGGYDDTTLSDFQLIDLDSGNVHEIRTNLCLPLSHHTITHISGSRVAIFGGLDKDRFLNSTLYEMSLSSGKIVRVKVDNDLAETNAGRCSHQAFEFFGCLCVTGGFRLGQKVKNVSIFDFQHGIWLTLDLTSYFRDTWIVVPLTVGYWILNSACTKGRMLFYNQNKQPFVDINDDHLLNFFSQLMMLNTASRKLKKLEQENIDLLNKVESERRKLADRVMCMDTESMARQVTELISERDQLQQKIMTLEIFHEKQQKRQNRKPPAAHKPGQKDQTPAIEILREIEKLKKDSKSEIAALSESNAALFTQIEARMHHDKNTASRVLPQTKELAHAVRSVNISEMAQQIARTEKEVSELEERLASLNSRNQSIEENLIEAAEYLQTVSEQNQSIKSKLGDLTRSYYAGKKDLMMANHQENSMSITAPNRDLQTLKILQSQGTVCLREMEKYKTMVPALKSKLISMLNGILEFSEEETATERIKSSATTLVKLISDIVAIHNAGARLLGSKSEEISLPQTDSSGPAVGPDTAQRQASRVRTCTNFSSRTFDLENGIWCDFYNSIISLVDELDEQEKKGFV